jgi:hypothetical protein
MTGRWVSVGAAFIQRGDLTKYGPVADVRTDEHSVQWLIYGHWYTTPAVARVERYELEEAS